MGSITKRRGKMAISNKISFVLACHAKSLIACSVVLLDSNYQYI